MDESLFFRNFAAAFLSFMLKDILDDISNE